jgi:hypothetical protein
VSFIVWVIVIRLLLSASFLSCALEVSLIFIYWLFPIQSSIYIQSFDCSVLVGRLLLS